MIKKIKLETPKDDLTKILGPKTVPQGNHVVYRHINDEYDTCFMV